MLSTFSHLNPSIQAFLAGLFTFLITVLGSSIVFFFHELHKSILNGMLALSGGIMFAASYFSLLAPGIEISNKLHYLTWFVILIGFLSGGTCLYFSDKIIDSLSSSERYHSSLKRSLLLFFSITLHNIPEGLVIGVAFGAIPFGIDSASMISALTLTMGIALQNFPEGSAISLPLRRDGLPCMKSFLLGSISALVEPIFAFVGALIVLKVRSFLPFIMAFAASAMIFVVVKELIPESQSHSNKGFMTTLFLVGFSIMMFLELILN